MNRARTSLAAVGAAAALSLGGILAAAPAAHAADPLDVDVVNITDFGANGQEIGDEVAVLDTLTPSANENTPAGTASVQVENVGDAPVTVTATNTSGSTESNVVQPGQSTTLKPPVGDVDDRVRGILSQLGE